MSIIKLLLVMTFLLPISISSTVEDNFMTNVNNNYDYYQILVDEDNAISNVVIIQGVTGNKLSISLFYLNIEHKDYWLRLTIPKRKIFGTKDDFGVYYEIELDENEEFTIELYHSQYQTILKSYNLQTSSITQIKENGVVGKAEHRFPSNSHTPITIDWPLVIFIGCGGISVFVIFFIAYLYKKRKGKFAILYQNLVNNNTDEDSYIDTEGEVIQDIEVQTKKERIDSLFKQYKNGNLTEQQLNAELRRMWQDHDEDDE